MSAYTTAAHEYREHHVQGLLAFFRGLHNCDRGLNLDITWHGRAKHVSSCCHRFEVVPAVCVGFDAYEFHIVS